MDDIEILKSKRGNPIVYHGGFVYMQHRLTDKKRIFRCESCDPHPQDLARVAANVKLNS